MERGLIPFQKKNGSELIFRFQFGVEVRLHFHGIGRTVRRSSDGVLKDFQELLECSYGDAAVCVFDNYSQKDLTEKFLGQYTGISSVESLVELFVKILCFADRNTER